MSLKNPAQEQAYSQAEGIGHAFVRQYYEVFQKNRIELMPMYHPEAWFFYEDKKAVGHEQIRAILEGVRFGCINFEITKVDCQPTGDAGVVLLVTGRLKTDDDPPHSFNQSFILKHINGNYFICHDIFRLAIHDSS